MLKMTVELLSEWSFWYHPTKTEDWSKESYIFIHRVNTAEALWGMLKQITMEHLLHGMYFLMRGDVFPDWTVEELSDGGYWSLKINHHDALETWYKWISYMVAEKVCNTHKGSFQIQGLSFSPKLNNSIIKLWNDDSRYNQVHLIHSDLDTSTCKYFPFYLKNS